MNEILITALVVPLVGLVVWMVKQFITTLEKVQKRSEEKDDKFLTSISNTNSGLSAEHVEIKEGQSLIVTTVKEGFDNLKKKINKQVM